MRGCIYKYIYVHIILQHTQYDTVDLTIINSDIHTIAETPHLPPSMTHTRSCAHLTSYLHTVYNPY